MKIYSLFILTIAILLTGCRKNIELDSEIIPAKTIPVTISLAGEYSISESPLTRALESSDLVYIALYSKGSTGTTYSMESEYFNDCSTSIPILNLDPQKKYKFIVDIIKNGRYNVYGSDSYFYCWSDLRYVHAAFQSTSKPPHGLGKGGMTEKHQAQDHKYPKAERFYGELSDYVPSETGAKNIEIDLKRGSFGLKATVTGITDGTVDIKIKNNDRIFVNQTEIPQDWSSGASVYTFYELYTAWLNSANYTEELTVSVVWNRGVGVKQDLGSRSVTIHRNKLNEIRINLGSDDGNANVGVTTESAAFTTEDVILDAHY